MVTMRFSAMHVLWSLWDWIQCMCYGHYESHCNACVMVIMRFSALHVLWSLWDLVQFMCYGHY